MNSAIYFALSLALSQSAQKPADSLHLTAKPLIGVTGGPVCIEVCLRNRDLNSVLSVVFATKMPTIQIGKLQLVSRGEWGIGRPTSESVTLKPGDTVRRIIYLHHDYVFDVKGDHEFRMDWGLHVLPKDLLGGTDPLPARAIRLSATGTVSISPRSGDLVGLIEDMGRRLERWGLTERSKFYRQSLLMRSDPGCIPELLRAYDESDEIATAELAETLIRAVETATARLGYLYGYVLQPKARRSAEVLALLYQYYRANQQKQADMPFRPKTEPNFFDRTNNSRRRIAPTVTIADRPTSDSIARLTESQLRELLALQDVWTRAQLYVMFPSKCPDTWRARLFDDISVATNSPSSSDFERLIALLDADRYSERIKAQFKLTQFGDVIRPRLRECLARPLSLEVRTRIDAVMKDLKKVQLSEKAERFLEFAPRNSQFNEIARLFDSSQQ